MKQKYLLTALLCWTIFFSVSCSKRAPEGNMHPGYILLSFDDHCIKSWYRHLSLLDSLDIKATFFISSYHTLSKEDKNKLRAIEAAGHEIAYHTTNHEDLLKLYTRHALTDVMNQEIKPDLTLMRNDGFNPENFAYPYGQHDGYLDIELLKSFNSVRCVCNPKNYYKAFATERGKGRVLFAENIDGVSKVTDQELDDMLQTAHNMNTAVSLYAHEINMPGYRYSVSVERLKYIASLAKKYNLQFITTRELTH
jgi:peptidoglycan-N-acetylglucosamine deacetylase